MRYIKKFELTYVEPEIQYDTIDFSDTDIIEAEYIIVSGFPESPDISALPRPFIGHDAFHQGIYIPDALMDDETDIKLKIYSMRNIRLPMFIQGELNEIIYNGIIMSYANREYAHTDREIEIGKSNSEKMDPVKINILSSAYRSHYTNGASLIGPPGTGKTTALRITIKDIPRAILHRNEHGHYIQIPIVYTTAFANSNLTALFQSFATYLDLILDTGDFHKKQLTSNLGKQSERIISWIRMYHIGAWIVEEISFFTFSSDKSNSFENIVTILQETGVFLFCTANQDVLDKIGHNLRLERRLLSTSIDMSQVARDKGFIELIVKEMWKYMLPEIRDDYTDEIGDAIYESTLGSIDMISLLLILIQKNFLKSRDYKLSTKVTPKLIQDIAKKNLAHMKDLFKDGQSDSLEMYLQTRNQFESMIINEIDFVKREKMKAKIEQDLESGYDHFQKYLEIKNAITDVTDDYTEKQIKTAFAYCEKNVENFRSLKKKNMIKVVINRLNMRKKKTQMAQKKKIEDNYEKLFQNLNIR